MRRTPVHGSRLGGAKVLPKGPFPQSALYQYCDGSMRYRAPCPPDSCVDGAPPADPEWTAWANLLTGVTNLPSGLGREAEYILQPAFPR